MIEFKPITLQDKPLYESYLQKSPRRGCECSFGNAFLWGSVSYALLDEQLLVLARYGNYYTYFFPFGTGDKTAALHALKQDAEERGIPFRICGMVEDEAHQLSAVFHGKFRYKLDRNSFDYVYETEKLAWLRGKKLQSKRNHFNRFQAKYPQYRVEPLSAENVKVAEQMAEAWFKGKDKDFEQEKSALYKAFAHLEEGWLEGLVLWIDDRMAAFTVASRFYDDTFDVHFEKADTEFDGAYAAINCEFARYIEQKYGEIRYLDREEDMGLSGLRNAKLSYRPHHLVEKVRAEWMEKAYEGHQPHSPE